MNEHQRQWRKLIAMSTKTDGQTLLWAEVTKNEKGFNSYRAVISVPDGQRPEKLWTLFHHTDPETPPELPFTPEHGKNAFIEDYVHDYNLAFNEETKTWQLHYYSRVADRPVWLLLEY